MQNRSTIFVLDSNDVSMQIIKSYFEELNFDLEIKLFSDYKKACDEIEINEENPIVLVNIPEKDDCLKDVFEKIKLHSSRIIATSTDYSTNNIVKVMRMGAKDFIPKPIIKEELRSAIEKLIADDSCLEKENNSKIITIYSNKGGIGKTTIATNLAYEIAKNTYDKVALIDLNLQLGDISTFLNLQPAFDSAYVIKNLVNKKDDSIIKAFEKYENTNLYVLSDPNFIEQSESITPQEIETLFVSLKKIFPYIIIDMSSNIDPNSLKILDKSDWILFTTIVNIPAIRNAQRCLNLFESRRYPKEKVKIIVNRYMENDEIKVEDIETALNQKIYWKIPNNYFSIMESINKGIPVSNINTNSNIANSFRDLASEISEDIIEQAIAKYRNK